MRKQMIVTLLSLLTLIFISGCGSAYSKYYTSYDKVSSSELRKIYPELEFLSSNEEPIVYSTQDLDKEILKLNSKRYYMIGYSAFNGSFESKENLADFAKDLGAKIAIYTWKYTNTQTNSGVLAMPKTNYSNTYISGNVGGTSYSGTAYTKSTGTSYTPYSITQRRYDQTAVFFVKSNYPYKFGTRATTNITREERIKIGQNGVRVNIIVEDSPAYNSNLLIGDIILTINSNKISGLDEYSNLVNDCVDNNDKCVLEVYRDNSKQIVEVNFKEK